MITLPKERTVTSIGIVVKKGSGVVPLKNNFTRLHHHGAAAPDALQTPHPVLKIGPKELSLPDDMLRMGTSFGRLWDLF